MVKVFTINRNIADLWTEPKFNSERASQLLFGEIVSVISTKSRFTKLRQSDGYTGWVDSDFLSELKTKSKAPNYIVTSNQALTKDKSGKKINPYFISYGSRIYGQKSVEKLIRVNNSGSATFYVNSSNLKPIISIKRESVTATAICTEAKRFLGVPYLWGGKSPLGFDCSGMIQAILGRFGIEIARDTKDQIKFGTNVNRSEINRGDLLFFKRHVAIAIDQTRFIHCSAGGGGVTINSLDPESTDYRKDLDIGFVTARRVLC